MMRIQLPTGKIALVDENWWFGLSDDEVSRFFEQDYGSEVDPLTNKYTEETEAE